MRDREREGEYYASHTPHAWRHPSYVARRVVECMLSVIERAMVGWGYAYGERSRGCCTCVVRRVERAC